VAQPDETKEEEPSGGKKADLLDSDLDSDSDGLDGLDAGVEDGYTAAAGECAAFDETDSDEEELPIEAKARELDAESAREAAQDAEELRQQQAGMLAPKEEDNVDEVVGLVGIDGSEGSVPSEQLDLEAMLQRIHDTVRQIENFKSLPPEKKRETPRSVLQQKLVDDCATYYGYLPFLISKFFDIFTPSQTLEFLNANETDRPVTIRTNTLKTRRKDLQQSLQARGMRLEAMDKWSKVGMVVYQSPVPIGATPEYLAGHYIIQSAASLLPVMALAPAANERVLDMCAAPGGKTSHISALMKNTGVVFANDLKRERLRALNANLHRLGAHNAVVTSYDGRRYPSVLRGFDRALLDAPCTGLGVIAKDPGVKLTVSGGGVPMPARACMHRLRQYVWFVVQSRPHVGEG
jgi:25S rRNA (cytosine2870-C5)-methyltransferase